MRAKSIFGLLLGAVSRALHCLFAFGPCCRFTPSCSAYAKTAIGRHGLFAGFWLAVGRLFRCHPFGAYGFDPVPDFPKISRGKPRGARGESLPPCQWPRSDRNYRSK